MRLAKLVPAFFAPTAVFGIVLTLVNGGTPGFVFRCTAVLALCFWIAIRVVGTVPINSATAEWQLSAPPNLRRQGGGQLMQLSSMGGHIAFPAFSLYHATKWGIEGFYEAFAQEVEPFGIHTTLVEPGMIRTSFYEAATRVPLSEPYHGGPADRTPIPLEQMPGSQTKVVAAMIEAALAEKAPRRLLLGSDAYGLVTDALKAETKAAPNCLVVGAMMFYTEACRGQRIHKPLNVGWDSRRPSTTRFM